jgi:hypothetical protein
MIILRQKEFRAGEHGDKEWEKNKKEEIERNKERDELLKKSSDRERAQANIMFDDTDTAGRERFIRNQIKSGAIGLGTGYIAGRVINSKLIKPGSNWKKNAIVAGSAIIGSKVAKGITRRKNVRTMEEIWNKGDKEVMDYLKSSKEDKRKKEKDYSPIGWRVDKKGNYRETPIPYNKEHNEERIEVYKDREKVRRYMNELDSERAKKFNKK